MKKFTEYFSKRLEEPGPEFHNTPNKLIRSDGKEYWISRSPASVVVVLGIYKDNIFVLAEQRSEIMDEPGRWCVVSGYLDWDETGFEAAKRELYEEVGFDCRKYIYELITDNDEQPFFVNSHPSENRQNVALTYCFIYEFGKGLPKLGKSDEIKRAEWIPIDRVFNKEMYDWAFSHDIRIEMAVNKFKSYLH